MYKQKNSMQWPLYVNASSDIITDYDMFDINSFYRLVKHKRHDVALMVNYSNTLLEFSSPSGANGIFVFNTI